MSLRSRFHLRGLWRRPDFLKLWAGQTVSNAGSLVTGFALPLAAIVQLHASAAQVALLSAAGIVPVLALGLMAGALGRLLASMQVIEAVATLTGVALGGTLGQTIGLRPTLFVAVAGGLLAPLWLARSPLRALHVLPERSTPRMSVEVSNGTLFPSADTRDDAGL